MVFETFVCVCTAVNGEAEGDNPLRMVGRLILQQSYICALIAMMVKQTFSIKSRILFSFYVRKHKFYTILEHYYNL